MASPFSFKIPLPKRLRRKTRAPPASSSTIAERKAVQLPIEMHEQIIDAAAFLEPISERLQMLRSCALTCKAWLPRSQYNLFRCVQYDLSTKVQLRKHTYNPFRRDVVDPPGPFVLEVLANVLYKSPNLQHLVREIDVILPGDPYELGQWPTGPYMLIPSIALDHLGYCSSVLPALNTLRLIGFHRDVDTLESLEGVTYPSPPSFRSVTTLELHHILFRYFFDFVGIVTALVNLRALECEHVHWWRPSRAIQPFAISRLRLEGLNEYEETSTRYQKRDIGPLLAAAATSLVDLTIDAAELLRPPTAIPSHLRPLASLRVLRVKWLLNSTSEDRNTTSARALASASHPYLQTLILHVDTRLSTNPREGLAVLGRELDDTLALGSKFPALQVVALHLEVDPYDTEPAAPRWWDDALQTVFPLTYGTGIMRIFRTSQFQPRF